MGRGEGGGINWSGVLKNAQVGFPIIGHVYTM